MTYLALPNYGEVAHQTLATFRQELQESAVLRDWWTRGQPATAGPKLEEFLQNFDQLNQYLGDEIVLSGTMDAEQKSPKLLAIAEIRKPGLDKFLQQWIAHEAGTEKPGVRVLSPQQLDLPTNARPGAIHDDLLILVRPDFVVAASDLATLRSFNTRLNTPNRQFAATPFGQRIAQEYPGGVTLLGAADVHKVLRASAAITKDSQQNFERSGFADMQYAVWKHARSGDQSVSQAELSFTGPRHGAAAWLAKPAQLGSLDFVSPKAMMAFTVVLTSLPQIFDDVKGFSDPSKPNGFNAIEGGQKALGLDLKDDLLSLLAGELTIEVDSLAPPQPAAKVIFKVNDVAHLHKTLNTLLTAAQMPAEHVDGKEFAYDIVRIPNQGGSMSIAYAFVDGYLIIASEPETLTEALRLHSSGASLAKSAKFLASLPPGQSPAASGLFYQDPSATAAMTLRQLAPQLADALAPFTKAAPPSVVRLYGDESAIREQSNSGSFDMGSALVVAAIAIPNLVRSRMAANEASAVGSVRTVNTAQVTYAATYPKRGFAADLATLGYDPHAPSATSPEHAGFLEEHLANASCTGSAWCTKSGYNFRVTSFCKVGPCTEYVVVATPVDTSTGTRSFCSTSDAIIRYKLAPVSTPPTPSQCRTWPALQ